MTFTAEARYPASHPSWWRIVLLAALLGLSALSSPPPWSALWLGVPLGVALALIGGWRFGAWGTLVPIALLAWSLTWPAGHAFGAWWLPAAALTGVWMGLREEGGGPLAGAVGWMLLPLLVVCTAMPYLPGYVALLRELERGFRLSDGQVVDIARKLGTQGSRLTAIQQDLVDREKLIDSVLPFAVPSVTFVWLASLVWAGRAFAARIAGTLRWPALSRPRIAQWRLPDAALWLLLAGLGWVVAQWSAASPAAWALLLNTALGFCVQGIAVVESLALARGIPPSVFIVTMVVVFMFAWPVLLLATFAVGLSDVWLDYRGMEAPPEAKTP